MGVVITGLGTVLADAPAGGSVASAATFLERPRIIFGAGSILIPGEQKNLVFGSVHCNCAEFHDKAGGKFGCGASWLLATEADLAAKKQTANPVLHVVTEGDAVRYWPAAEAVAAAAPTALATFQAKATSWQTGVAGLVTVAGLAALTASRTAIHGLRSPWDLAVIAAIIAATAASAANIAIAVWVNVGLPSVRQVSAAGTLANADLAPLSRAARASTWLRRGTWAAAAAFVLGFFALAAFIAVPGQGAGDTQVSITLYQATTTPAPTPSSGVTPTVSPGTAITVTTTASPVCAVIAKNQPAPPASPGGTPVISVIEPNSTPSPSQATAIPVPAIAGVSPGCPSS